MANCLRAERDAAPDGRHAEPLHRKRHVANSETSVNSAYHFQHSLGSGNFGCVFHAVSNATGLPHAIKVVPREDAYAVHGVAKEVRHLCQLDHPHIVKLHEWFEDEESVYLVMDLCTGGTLQKEIAEHFQQGNPIQATFVVEAMRQLLMAISHVHAQSIVHLDLKSENVMIMPKKRTLPPAQSSKGHYAAQPNERPHVLIIDLGVAHVFRPGNFRLSHARGTPNTMAPEVWRGEVSPKADIFSLGVVLFEMLSFRLPFQPPATRQEAVMYWRSKPAVPWEDIRQLPVSDRMHAIELCRQMLMMDQTRRPSALECLRKQFLSVPECQPSSSDHVDKLSQILDCTLQHRSPLHRGVALTLAHAWPANQLPSIKLLFEELDVARTGCLCKAQISNGLERLGVERSRASSVAYTLDVSCKGAVRWTQFVAACIQLGSSTLEEDLAHVFQAADSDGDGFLSQSDLAKLMATDSMQNEVSEIFGELAEHVEHEPRVDWPAFLRHFCEG